MKYFYGVFIIGFITLVSVNVIVARESNTRSRLFESRSSRNQVTRNAENPQPVRKLVYTYDASGNVIKRELVIVNSNTTNTTITDSTKISESLIDISVAETKMTKSSLAEVEFEQMEETEENVLVAGLTKSAISGVSNTEVVAAEIPQIENTFAEIKVDVYPNPTQGMLLVNITGVDIPQNTQIEIFTANGLLVLRKNDISYSNTVDITYKPNGIYIMRLTLGKEYMNTWRIVKN